MANPSVVIDIAAEYTGKKAFDKAGKSTSSLEKSVKSLGKAFAGVFAAQKVIAFGKASVKAFAEDQKAAAQLTQTLKNLGLGFANTGIEDFIQKMSLSTGVSDNELRPAMQKLLQTTLSVTESQKSMALALDISAAGFGSAESVATDLSQAMVGNIKGLKKYNIGISQAELSTMSYAQIQEKLTKLFKGQAAAAADTYAGKINIIKNAAGEAQEAIGKGLIDALMAVGDDTNMQGLVDDILAVGQGIGYAISGAADLVKVLGSIPGFGFEGVGKNAPMPFTLNPLAILAQKGFQDQLSKQQKLEEKRLKAALSKGWIKGAAVNPTKDTILTREEAAAGLTPSKKRKMEAEQKAAAAAAKKRAEELAALQKSIAKSTKESAKAAADKAKLEKASAVFDLQKISIAAALKGKISEEEKTRLLLMQAIADEDANKAEKLQKKLEEIQAKNEAIAKSLTEISTATNPFQAWADSLTAAAALLGGMPALITATGALTPRGTHNIPQDPNAGDPGTGGGGTGGTGGTGSTGSGNTSIFGTGDTPEEIANKTANAAEDAAAAATAAAASVAESQSAVDALAEAATNGTPATGSSSMYNPNPYSAVGGPGYGIPYSPVYINVTNEGSVITQDNFVTAVNEALVLANQNGYNNYRPGAIVTNG
jgi:hypothetical protein